MKWKWQEGNWSVFPKRKYNEWHVAIPTDNGSGMKMALFEDGVPGDSDEEKEALARLIGASPNMLQWLQQIALVNCTCDYELNVNPAVHDRWCMYRLMTGYQETAEKEMP